MGVVETLDTLSDQSIIGLVGTKIIRAEGNMLFLDNGHSVCISEEEIETINYTFEHLS